MEGGGHTNLQTNQHALFSRYDITGAEEYKTCSCFYLLSLESKCQSYKKEFSSSDGLNLKCFTASLHLFTISLINRMMIIDNGEECFLQLIHSVSSPRWWMMLVTRRPVVSPAFGTGPFISSRCDAARWASMAPGRPASGVTGATRPPPPHPTGVSVLQRTQQRNNTNLLVFFKTSHHSHTREIQQITSL